MNFAALKSSIKNTKGHAKRKAPVSGTMPAAAQSKKIKIETDAESSDLASSKSSTQPPKFQIPVLSDSEEEQEDEKMDKNSVKLGKLRRDNIALRKKLLEAEDRLEQAEGKLVVMTDTMSKVHGVIEALIARTSEAARLFKVAAKLQLFLDDSQEVMDRESELREMRSFYKDNTKLVSSIVLPGEEAIGTLHDYFPALASRIFYHDQETTRALEVWKTSTLPDYGKLAERLREFDPVLGQYISRAGVDDVPRKEKKYDELNFDAIKTF